MNSSLKNKIFSLRIICILVLALNTLHSQTYTFTPAGATGRYGPTPTQVGNAYSTTNLNGQVTTINGIQSWTVPATGIYRVEAYGAKGGNGSAPTGGAGAKMQGEFSLTSGQVLKILVGQVGGNGDSGGGGGGSFVTDNSNTPLIIAAGAGGAAFLNMYSFGLTNNIGNSGTAGMPGSDGNYSTTASIGGVAGSGGATATSFTIGQGSGGGGLTGNGANGNPSTGGLAFVNGGTGGAGATTTVGIGGDGGFGGGGGGDWSNNTGAGGGGGYSGGGGGTHFGLGGGGGSYNAGSNQINTSGANAGNGFVVFTKLSGLNITQTSSISCYGQLTAALTASAFGGTAPYSYSWYPSVSSGSTASGLSSGSYTCIAIDASSVAYTNTFIITQPAPLVSTISQTNVSCFGGSNGNAKVNVSGGTIPYSYTWSPTSSLASSVTGLSAGAYTCLVKDASSCSSSATVTISEPAALSVFGIASSPTVCSGLASILIGGGALTYTWSNNVINAVAFTPSVTNNYTLTGTDAAGCTATAITAIVVNPSPTLNIAGSGTLCTGNALTLTAGGANSYTWNTTSTNPTVSLSPTLSTVYTVTGTATNGCQGNAVKTVSVINSTSVTALTTSSTVCIGSPVTLHGAGALTYAWSGSITDNLAFTPTLTSTYTVTGTGVCGTASAAITITVNSLPSVAANASNTIICSGSQLTLFGSGAVTYTWSGGVSNNISFPITTSAIYTVTGTDANGCQNTATKTISVNPLPVVTASVSAPVVCAGIPVIFNGGGASTYTWTGGVTNNSPFSPTISGSYVVTGTDLNGCQNTANTSISVIIVPVVTANSTSASVCYGNTVSLYGGGALSYTWAGTVINNAAFTPTITSTYTITGSNSCFTASNVITVTVNTLPLITANATNSSICLGNNTTLFGGGGVSYNWTGGITNNVSFPPSISATYTVTGTGANGCQNTAIKSITVNPLPTVTASASNSVFCFGNSTTLNGGGALTYTWTGNITNNSSFTPTITTTYTVTGTDANGCQNTAPKTITVNPLPVVSANASNTVICSGNTITLNGGGANTYTWSGGITNGLAFPPTLTTTYTVTGTNTLTGCTSTNLAIQTISVNSLPSVSVTTSNSIVCTGSTVTLNGANANTYSWTGGITNGIAFIPLSNLIYTVTGTNTLTGCTNTAVQGVTVNPLPPLTITVVNPVICFGNSVTLSASGANTYSWSGGVLNTIPFTPSVSANYSVSGTNTLTGCTSNTTQLILVNPLPVVNATVSSAFICEGNTVTLNGQGANTYTWTGGVINGISFSPSNTNSYSVNGTNTLTGCTSTNSAVQTITVNALPILSASSSSTIICMSETTTLNVTGAQTYTWNTDENTSSISITPSITTVYSVTGTDLNGCVNTTTLSQEVSDCLGINNFNEKTLPLSIFPNPNNGQFSISTDMEITLNIINDLGQVVKTITLNENNKRDVFVNDLPNGIYFIVGQKDKILIKQKIIVSK